MKKVLTIRCSSCGSAQVENIGNGIGRCQHCQSTMLLPKQNEEIIALLNTAHVYRENFNYDLAIKSYQYVLEKDPQELSAYEGILLSEYGIEYVKDKYTNKLIPTCHRAHFKSILEDSNYQALLSLVDDNQKQVIEAKALEIDKLQKAIERQLKNEESYDVFISYKATDKNGEKTEDSIIARNIYEELTSKNYKVFFSEKSLEDRLGSEYEPIIFKALHTSKIFILVGTSKENIESTWVRNEWSRFIDRIKNEPQTLNGNNFIPVFKDMNPYDMPKVNNNFVQGVDASKLGYTITVLDGVQKILKPEKEKKVIESFDSVENIEQFDKIRRQRRKEIKKKNWNDLQTNPLRKKQKILYYLFLLSPIFFGLFTASLLFIEAIYFITHIAFYLFIVCIALSIALLVAVTIVQTKRFGLKPLVNLVVPAILIILTFSGFIYIGKNVPITLNGYTGFEFQQSYYSRGLVYYLYSDDYVTINHSARNLGNFAVNKNGQTHLILPDKIANRDVIGMGITLPDEIEVLVAPKGCTFIDIYVSEKSKLKQVYFAGSDLQDHCTFTLFYTMFRDGEHKYNNELDPAIYYDKTLIKANYQSFSKIEQKTYNY